MRGSNGACRVCGGTGTALKAGDYDYLRCGTCGTLQKQLTPQQFKDIDPGYDPGLFLANASEDRVRAFLHIGRHRKTLEDLCARFGLKPQGLRLLDIGCGMGGFLAAGRDLGMIVEGFEPSNDHSVVARDVLKLPVTPDFFSSEKVGDRRFDIVILSEVIEHIYDQEAFIADVTSVLAPGGVLRIITPNADSLAARLTGTHWAMLVPIDHVGLLTKKAFAYLIPPGFDAQVGTREAPHTFMTTLASWAKSAIKGRPVNEPGIAPVAAPKLVEDITLKGKLLRGLLTVGSAPFYLAARATDRAVGLEAFIFRKTA